MEGRPPSIPQSVHGLRRTGIDILSAACPMCGGDFHYYEKKEAFDCTTCHRDPGNAQEFARWFSGESSKKVTEEALASSNGRTVSKIQAPPQDSGQESDGLLNAALYYASKNIPVFPCKKNKKPFTNHGFKEATTDYKRIKGWWEKWPNASIAIPTGAVSGNIEILDFDFKAKFFSQWTGMVEDEAPGLIDRLVIQGTQSGGKHVIYRCPRIEIPGSLRLAHKRVVVSEEGKHSYHGKEFTARKDDGEWCIFLCCIETRGTGGYFLVSPSPGYTFTKNDLENIPEITPDEREVLFSTARRLNEVIKVSWTPQTSKAGDKPGDLFNQHGDIRPILEKHDWKPAGSRGEYEHWTRPGKDRGISASLIDGKVFNVFSTNSNLEPGAYSPFSVYAQLEHEGDFEAAAKGLSEQGYNAGDAVSAQTEHIDPEPLPDELLPVVSFDLALLPDRLKPWVKDIADRMQCPPDFIAAAVMTTLSVLIARKIAIRPQARTDWTVICNLWFVIIGRPGMLKSPALEAAISALKRLIAVAIEAHEKEMAEYEITRQTAKLKREAAEKTAKSKLAKDPDADVSHLLKIDTPNKPKLKRYMFNDTSHASAGELFRFDPSLLGFRDEIVSLLKNLDREDQAEARGFYLTGWNGDSSYTFDRIGRGLNLHIPAYSLSVLGGTQPGRMAEYINNAVRCGAADDGLIQRFNPIWPDNPGKWVDVDRWPDNEAKNKAFEVYEYLDKLNPSDVEAKQDIDLNGNPDGLPYLRFDTAGLELFQEWRGKLEAMLRSGELHPALESHFAKYRKTIPALALILHLADHGQGPVSKIPTLKALAWGDYLMSHARRAYGSVSQPEISVAKAILKKIKTESLKQSFSSRDVWRPGWAMLSDRDQVAGALELLVDYRWLRAEKVTTGGRPATIYHAHKGAL